MTDTLRDQLALLAPTVDVPAGHADFRRRIVVRRRRRRWLAGSLAVVTGGVVIAGLYALTLRDQPDEPVNPAFPSTVETTTVETTTVETTTVETTPPETTTAATATGDSTAAETQPTSSPLPGYTVIGTSDANISELGSLAAAGNDSQLQEMWSRYNIPDSTPDVDFSVHVVLAMTIADRGCPSTLIAMDHSEPNTFTMVFAEGRPQTDPSTECSDELVGRTFIVSADRAMLGDQFVLRLPGNEGFYRDKLLDVIVTSEGTGLLPPDRSAVSTAESYQDAAEHAIRSGLGDGSQALCDLPASTDIGTRFDCTGTPPDGSAVTLVAQIDGPEHVSVNEAAPDASNPQ